MINKVLKVSLYVVAVLVFIIVVLFIVDKIQIKIFQENAKKTAALALKYTADFEAATGTAKYDKAREILIEIINQELYQDIKNADNRLIERMEEEYIKNYQGNDLKEFEAVIAPLVTVKGLGGKYLFYYYSFGNTLIITEYKNRVLSFMPASSNGQTFYNINVIQGLNTNGTDVIIATYFESNGSSARPALMVITFENGIFNLKEVQDNRYRSIELQKFDGKEEIVCIDTPYIGYWPAAERFVSFPRIFKWDGNKLKETTLTHGDYIEKYYKDLIDELIAGGKEYMRGELDNFISKSSEEMNKFWNERLKGYRKK